MNNNTSKLQLNITPANKDLMEKAKSSWDAIAHPLNSLGILEEYIIKLCGIYGTEDFDISKRCVVVACADNGVVAENVTQSDSSVTASVAKSMLAGNANINIMARAAGADTVVVDAGMLSNEVGYDLESWGSATVDNVNGKLVNVKLHNGTDNIATGHAMTRKDAITIINSGIKLVGILKEKGYMLVATGEMGIGNTTTSSAVSAVIIQEPVEVMTGRGAGLTSKGLDRKIEVIRKAINFNKPDSKDAIDVLSKVGGYDIAFLAGIFLGGAVYHIPVVIDGFIAATAALVAYCIDNKAKDYMLPSHMSKEPAMGKILDYIGLEAIIHGRMCLGEGTGAVCLFPLLDIALAEYKSAHRFVSIDVEQYKELK